MEMTFAIFRMFPLIGLIFIGYGVSRFVWCKVTRNSAHIPESIISLIVGTLLIGLFLCGQTL